MCSTFCSILQDGGKPIVSKSNVNPSDHATDDSWRLVGGDRQERRAGADSKEATAQAMAGIKRPGIDPKAPDAKRKRT